VRAVSAAHSAPACDAAWSVPLPFAVMIGVSLLGRPPRGAEDLMLAMHVPEPAESVPGRR
jgi:hypothetical protein